MCLKVFLFFLKYICCMLARIVFSTRLFTKKIFGLSSIETRYRRVCLVPLFIVDASSELYFHALSEQYQKKVERDQNGSDLRAHRVCHFRLCRFLCHHYFSAIPLKPMSSSATLMRFMLGHIRLEAFRCSDNHHQVSGAGQAQHGKPERRESNTQKKKTPQLYRLNISAQSEKKLSWLMNELRVDIQYSRTSRRQGKGQVVVSLSYFLDTDF